MTRHRRHPVLEDLGWAIALTVLAVIVMRFR